MNLEDASLGGDLLGGGCDLFRSCRSTAGRIAQAVTAGRTTSSQWSAQPLRVENRGSSRGGHDKADFGAWYIPAEPLAVPSVRVPSVWDLGRALS